MFNQVTLLGYVGNDPEVRSTPNGVTVANLRLATSERWTDKGGEKQERTEWHNLTAFDKLADVLSKYVHKGDLLFAQGRLQTDKWQDKNGQDRYTTKTILTGLKLMPNQKAGVTEQSESQTRRPANAAKNNHVSTMMEQSAGEPDAFDDEIPF